MREVLAAVVVVEIKSSFVFVMDYFCIVIFVVSFGIEALSLFFFKNIRIGCVNVLLKQLHLDLKVEILLNQTFVSKPGKPIQIPY